MTLPENCLIKHIIDVKPADLESVITDVKPREFFKAIYLNELDNFKAYGLYVNDTLKSIISTYKSIYDSSWYITHVFYSDLTTVPTLLNYCINLFESEGIYKFYNLVPKNYNTLDKLYWDPINLERYIQVDEVLLPSKTKSFYINYWMILQERNLCEIDYIVRCNFLKQEYRDTLPIGGNI